MAEDVSNHPDRDNKLYLWGVLQDHRFMEEVVKENFTGHPKLNPQMLMFILEVMAPRAEVEGVSAASAHVSAMPVTFQKLASSVDAFDYQLRALEDTVGLEVGGVAALSINARRNQSRRNGTNGGEIGNGIVNIP